MIYKKDGHQIFVGKKKTLRWLPVADKLQELMMASSATDGSLTSNRC